MASPGIRPSARDYAVCYALYILLIAIVVIVTFGIWRQTVLNVVLALNTRPEANTLIYFVSMIVMGLISFVAVIGAEPYLRKGVERGLLLRRFARLAIPFIVIGLIGVLVNLWAISSVVPPAALHGGSSRGLLQTTTREAV